MNRTLTIVILTICVILISLSWSCGRVLPYSPDQLYTRFEPLTNPSSSSASPPASLITTAGIYESPNINRMLDSFSANKASPSCTATHLTNQDGNLCLSAEQIRLLQNRGAN